MIDEVRIYYVRCQTVSIALSAVVERINPYVMKPAIRIFALVIAGFAGALFSRGQGLAPAALSPCFIQYSATMQGPTTSTRLYLYNADNTYVEINSYYTGSISISGIPSSGTNPATQGTYIYVVDSTNPAHATIIYNGGGSTAPPSDELYFATATTGSQAGTLLPLGVTKDFTLYPQLSTSGGTNCSNRCGLIDSATANTGFVIQGNSPRWVLIRAVGATLSGFGVTPVVSGPSFTLYGSQQTVLGTSSVWSADPNLVAGYSAVFALVGNGTKLV